LQEIGDVGHALKDITGASFHEEEDVPRLVQPAEEGLSGGREGGKEGREGREGGREGESRFMKRRTFRDWSGQRRKVWREGGREGAMERGRVCG